MTETKEAPLNLSPQAKNVLKQIDSDTRLGELRKIAKEIKKDHDLALELWSTEEFTARLLAILILDRKNLTEDLVNELVQDMSNYHYNERTKLMDWLFANQLTKDKKRIAMMMSWKDSPLPLQRRTFWYYQGRLRWTGQTPPDNTEELLTLVEEKILQEAPEVQWAMNFTAGWIGVYDRQYRDRCIKIGEQTGLFKDQMVSKGCTPDYLPEFIRIEAEKREDKE